MGAEERFDDMRKGVDGSMFCPEDSSLLSLKNNMFKTSFPAGTSSSVWIEFSTCKYDPELCITDYESV